MENEEDNEYIKNGKSHKFIITRYLSSIPHHVYVQTIGMLYASLEKHNRNLSFNIIGTKN